MVAFGKDKEAPPRRLKRTPAPRDFLRLTLD